MQILKSKMKELFKFNKISTLVINYRDCFPSLAMTLNLKVIAREERPKQSKNRCKINNNKKFDVSFIKANLIITLLIAFLSSCKNTTTQTPSLSCNSFSIENFNPIANWQPDSTNQKTIFIDYDNALDGFMIPSVKQLKDETFIFEFSIKNTSISPQKFYYKIYYQNESYKFEEYDSLTKSEHIYAEENFYGSWENTATTFKQTNIIEADNSFHNVQDAFRIVGNPRNDKRFFQDGMNDRWKRNPLVVAYSFLLVVATESDLKNIPQFIQDINQKNNDHYSSPYYYYLHGNGKQLKNTIAYISPTTLKVKAQPDLGNGIYINDRVFGGKAYDKSYFCDNCGQDSNIYKNAPIQQFINYVDISSKMQHIPVIADIQNDYSKMDYNWNKSFYTKDELIPTLIHTTKHPCQTVFSDPKEKKIIIKNPATKYGEWKKESVGIITRHGFTYGKYRAKVKLTELLNKDNVWNGLTNAIWLITQGGGEWNFRRGCNKEGYMASYWGGAEDKRVPAVDYTEIDFEILKTPPYCPDNTFPPVYKKPTDNNKNLNSWNITLPEEITNNDADITVACTNWDMACWEPKKFDVGCQPIEYKGQKFEAHRWDRNYRAITEKKEENDDELFKSDFYYFEIDWRPTEIIWRIGKTPDNMRVVGYMNDQITSIANNQMLLIITQEYHNTQWWPGTPYLQENIPFPSKNQVGLFYDLTIE